MLGMAPDYDHLPVIHKVEVFEYALDSTSGEDLHKVGAPPPSATCSVLHILLNLSVRCSGKLTRPVQLGLPMAAVPSNLSHLPLTQAAMLCC